MSGRSLDMNDPAIRDWVLRWPGAQSLMQGAVKANTAEVRRTRGRGIDALALDGLANAAPPSDLLLTPDLAWDQPAAVDYVPGGFLLGANQLNARTNPPGIALTYDPPGNAPLPAGTHRLTAYPTDRTRYYARPIQVDLIVNKALAQVTLKPPAPIDYTKDGVRLQASHFTIRSQPDSLVFDFDPPLDEPLEAGTHEFTIVLRPDHQANANHRIDPVPKVQVTVNKAKARVALKSPPQTEYKTGGVRLAAHALIASCDPAGLVLDIAGPHDQPLEAGEHDVTVVLRDGAHENRNHTLDAVLPVRVTIDKMPATVALTAPQPVDYVDGGFVLKQAQFGLVSDPADLVFDFSPALDAKLNAGTHDLSVTLKAGEHANRNHRLDNLVPVQLVVQKAPATVTLANVTVIAVPGGFVLTQAQFVAIKQPTTLVLDCQPATGQALLPGPHPLTATLANDPANANHQLANPAIATLTVNPCNFVIAYKLAKATVETTGDVFTLTVNQLCAVPKPNPGGTPIAYSHDGSPIAVGDTLPAGRHKLLAEPSDPINCSAEAANVTLTVKDSEFDKDRRKKAERAAKNPSLPKPFDPANSNTWTMTALRYDGGGTQGSCNGLTNNADRTLITNIGHGTVAGEHASAPQTGIRYHKHVNTGSGGISFGYSHTGGTNVEPVIYDYSGTRDGNTYRWDIGGKRGGPSAAFAPTRIVR